MFGTLNVSMASSTALGAPWSALKAKIDAFMQFNKASEVIVRFANGDIQKIERRGPGNRVEIFVNSAGIIESIARDQRVDSEGRPLNVPDFRDNNTISLGPAPDDDSGPLISVQPSGPSRQLPKAEIVTLPQIMSSTGDRPFMVTQEEFSPVKEQARADIVQISQAPNAKQAADILTAPRPATEPKPWMTLDQLSQIAFTVYRHWSDNEKRELIKELQQKQAMGQRIRFPRNVQITQPSRLNPWLIAGAGLAVLALAGTAIAVTKRGKA